MQRLCVVTFPYYHGHYYSLGGFFTKVEALGLREERIGGVPSTLAAAQSLGKGDASAQRCHSSQAVILKHEQTVQGPFSLGQSVGLTWRSPAALRWVGAGCRETFAW